MIGKPTHLRLGNNLTACGLIGASYAAFDPRDVDCIRCRKTKIFLEKHLGTVERVPRFIPTWVKVSYGKPMRGEKVLAYYRDKFGDPKIVTAQFLRDKESECTCEYDCECIWDSDTNCAYNPKGWYELVENDNYGIYKIKQGVVTHWAPLLRIPED